MNSSGAPCWSSVKHRRSSRPYEWAGSVEQFVHYYPAATGVILQSTWRSHGGLRMKLDCYRIHADAPQLVPARPGRAWMDEPGRRFAHRCTPLTMANSTGWELLCPLSIAASWNGGP